MKIDNTIKPTTTPTTSRVSVRPSDDKQAQTNTSEPVTFSSAVAQLQNDTQQQPVDQAKVQEIKQAIAEGRFKINPEAIADKIIASAKDLISAQRRA